MKDKTAVRTAYLGSLIDAPPDVLVAKWQDKYAYLGRGERTGHA